MTHPLTPDNGFGTSSNPSTDASTTRNSRHRRLIGAVAVSLAAALGLAFWILQGRGSESTEDAYVQGNVVAVTARINGVVTAIDADDTDFVRAGMPLVKLDRTDVELALSRSEAGLAGAVRQVRARRAAAAQAQALVHLQAAQLEKAHADLTHRRRLLASGAVSGEEVRHAEDAMRAASAALAAARQQWAAARASIDRTNVASNPDVLAAAAQLRDAYVAASRTTIPAPVSGLVAKRNVQLGQKINPGVALMSVVPLDHLWVDANFRESQLRNIRIGQPVVLTADVYGAAVEYHGRVVGQDAGTGSAFSLLPAQNATGNWIKVMQRVPVRIALNPAEVAHHPLQLGLSMKVVVDTTRRAGARLTEPGASRHSYHTDVFAHELASANGLVERIIKANQ